MQRVKTTHIRVEGVPKQQRRRALGPERAGDGAIGNGVCLASGAEVEMASIALVVVEPGSDWPAFVRGAAHDIIALGQANGGLDAGALQRVCDRAERSQTLVRLAVLACSGNVDDESIHRRAYAASRLLGAVARADGHLVLSAGKGACAALRLGLSGLASTLRHALGESLATVSVRIGQGPDQPDGPLQIIRRQGQRVMLWHERCFVTRELEVPFLHATGSTPTQETP